MVLKCVDDDESKKVFTDVKVPMFHAATYVISLLKSSALLRGAWPLEAEFKCTTLQLLKGFSQQKRFDHQLPQMECYSLKG